MHQRPTIDGLASQPGAVEVGHANSTIVVTYTGRSVSKGLLSKAFGRGPWAEHFRDGRAPVAVEMPVILRTISRPIIASSQALDGEIVSRLFSEMQKGLRALEALITGSVAKDIGPSGGRSQIKREVVRPIGTKRPMRGLAIALQAIVVSALSLSRDRFRAGTAT